MDSDRVTRLHETGDAAHLVVNFGQYRGATLVQVAPMVRRQCWVVSPHIGKSSSRPFMIGSL